MEKDFKDILKELKRRRVFRVAAVYSGFAFIIFQIIDATFDTLGIPQWLGKYSIIALVLGFPIAVGLGWAFDITEQGVVRTKNKPILHDSRKPFVGNISLSIVASIAIILAVWGWVDTPEGRSEGYHSIAVLPFDNYMGDSSQDYFVDGMTEAIIAELTRLEGLKVISRTSVMRFRNSEKPLTEIAAELGVDAIVEGSVLKAGEEVRITAQLIDGLSDEHLWANSFVKRLDQILSLQRDVARAIADQINWTFKPEDDQYFQKDETIINSEAYELYLKGWDLRLKEGWNELNQATQYFQAAIALDSSLYQAYAAIPVVLFMRHGSPERGSPQALKAKSAIENALKLAPAAPETQIALALYRQIYMMDIPGTHQAFERAIELRPGDAEVRREYGLFLSRLGLYEDAKVQFEISRASDPLSPLSLRDLGMIHMRLGQPEQAMEYLERSQELMDSDWVRGSYHAMTLLVLNDPQSAHEIFKKMKTPFAYASRGDFIAAQRSGHDAELLHTVDSLLHANNFSDDQRLYRQGVLNGLAGDIERAMYFFEKMVAKRSPSLMGVIEDPAWDPVRHQPEYLKAMKDLGFPQPAPESFSDMLTRLYGPPPE